MAQARTGLIHAALIGSALLAAPAMGQFPGGGMGGGGGYGGQRHGGSGQRGGRNWQAAAIKPIKKADFDARVRADFAAADLDHNGLVTLQDVHAARDAKLAKAIDDRFNRVDTNHDGTISREEFAAWQRQIGGPDAGDQLMAEEDDRALYTARARTNDHHRLGGGDEDAADLVVAPVDANLLVNADLNHDLALSLAEDLAWQDARFDAADTDHDGTLSVDEIRALREKQVNAAQ